MDSGSGATTTPTSWHSYPYDLRNALETQTTLDTVAGKMITNAYTFNHLIFLSDATESKVLENNFSGTTTGEGMNRELREDDSTLHSYIEWGFTDAIGTVNSFLLDGNHDNHTGNLRNEARWASMKEQIDNRDGDNEITVEELKEIISYDGSDGKPNPYADEDLYGITNMQTIIFQPDSFQLDISFSTSTIRQDDPSFQRIFNESPFEN